ncbi:holin [Listeria phage LMTA-94]|uniref:Holin n=8 Tax=Pecentumvirus TaxID=1857844 RepID=S4UA14_9CAUD|nr:holin [Listeria phage A511]YP_007676803.1 holin [Listeria phage vB_LmoM_AG20]YP_008240124.1 holin [Listeria phage LP-125]YP_009043151.1 holin [Listeria phage LMSP-25]YP_009592691.1 holin [Listeria phage LP-064]YP_009616269.1 holin [Listeria phage LMTA-34]YP_009793542.1 holin [Listeria phage LMTA-94]YP_010843716.1 holin [Listeria phage WIL-1]QKN84349.1 holin [Listeria virus P61]QNL32107.1 holin [Listeria phage LP-Mix_6.2]WIW77372.1 holin [Listeria phage cka15]AAY52925.1 gp144 [Listeria
MTEIHTPQDEEVKDEVVQEVIVEEQPENVEEVVVPSDDEVKAKFMSYVPLFVTLILFLNTLLASLGWEPLAVSQDQLYLIGSSVATVIATVWSWYRNNNVTKKGLKRENIANQVLPKKEDK